MTPAIARPLLVTASALDRVRSLLLSWLGRPFATLYRDRELRIAWLGVLSIAAAFALTVTAPGALLTWGPLLLGVPHLLADGRYLIARRGLLARPVALVAVLVPAAAAWSGGGARMGALAIVAASVCARASVRARIAIAALGVALAIVAHRLGATADLVLAHLHNVVAIGLWLGFPWLLGASRRSSAHFAVPFAFAVAVAAIGSGLCDRWAIPALLSASDVNVLIPRLAFETRATWAARTTLLFAFAQSVHYGVWLRLLPEEDRERTGPRPFASSLEALARDASWPVVLIAAVVTIAFLAYGAVDAIGARDGYLRLATFHGPMELGLIALLIAERR